MLYFHCAVQCYAVAKDSLIRSHSPHERAQINGTSSAGMRKCIRCSIQ